MASHEREIRTMHSIWIDAVNAGDLARLLTLVAEDVVFLTPEGMRVRAYYRQSEMFFSRLIVRAVELTTVVAAVNQFQ